jgi:hypothetical protein
VNFKIKKRKIGVQYQQVVAEVCKLFDSGATVSEGQWVTGPDGRRELDVQIEGITGGRKTKAIIECKDFDPRKTGPVGIRFVDELDSKRHDIGADFSLICSNAGFTSDALRKAKRVGIGLISVMKKGDRRIRFSVKEEFYTRKVKLVETRIMLTGVETISLDNVRPEQICFENLPVINWVYRRIPIIISSNPIVNGSYTVTHALKKHLLFDWQGGSAEVTNFGFVFTIDGAWFAHQGEIDSTAGFYDWLRKRMRIAPLVENNFQVKGIDVYNGERISMPPDRELIIQNFLKGEVDMKFVLIQQCPGERPAPNLDDFIIPEDLATFIPHLPPEALRSSSVSKPVTA